MSGERLYRTGDLGRWLPSGDIEFCGRDDFQVKVGGFRIELGEVEQALAGCPGVRVAIAAAVGDRHHRRLVGYVVPAEGAAADDDLVTAVREHATAVLPGYMVPSSFMVLDGLPLTANGKVDRSHLPDPGHRPPADYTPPRTPVERTVAGQLGQVLGMPQVCVRANFFELGLNSVLVLRLHRQLQTALGRDFPLTLLFEHTSVRRLASSLADTAAGSAAGDRDTALDAAFARGQRNRQARRRVTRLGQVEETNA